MKKYIFLLIVIMIMAIGTSVNAESFFAEISGDKVIMRNTRDDGVVELKSVDIYNLEDYRYFGIRAMAESCGAEVNWDDATKTVLVLYNDLVISLKNNSSDIFINGIKYNFGYPVIIIDGKSYAPLDLYKAFTGELQLSDKKNSIPDSQTDGTDNGIYIEHGENSERITIKGAVNGLIHDFVLKNPDRIVLDISGISLAGSFRDGETYDEIRHFKGSDGVTRIVFDLNGNYKYYLNYEGNDIVVTISDSGYFAGLQELVEFRNNSIIIHTSAYDGYKIFRGTDPYSINAVIPGLLTDYPFTLDIEGEYVKGVSVSSNEEETMFSIELKKQCSFELEKLKESFIIGIYEPVVNGLTYHNSNDKQYVSLDSITSLVNIESINNKGTEAVIKVNDPNGFLTAGQVYINDDSVKSIFVSRNGNNAVIRITTKIQKFISGEMINGAASLALLDKDYSGFLVVISAGHGGRDPGAIVNGVYEAHLNLKIAEKLQKELEASGVNVYMLRTDDSFVSLDDRTYTANKMKADLFISIHCNTLDDKEFDGLMTLVHSGYLNYKNPNGKTAGTIIHQEVIESTGATDRGVRDRNKIIVLKDTAMPAVEIECGFLTNEAEFGKLLEDSYQLSIARGTAEGVLKVLDLMD